MRKAGVIITFLVCAFALGMVKSGSIQSDLQKNLVRLHITANSNSEYDQNIKLAVRDELIKSGSYDLEKLEERANAALSDLSAGYGAEVCYKKRFVPQKTYKNIALPEGIYNCIDVVLGKGGGENWWCVAYPPLCFTEAVSGEMSEEAKKELKKRLSAESLNTILKTEKVTYRFRMVEDFQKIMNFLD